MIVAIDGGVGRASVLLEVEHELLVMDLLIVSVKEVVDRWYGNDVVGQRTELEWVLHSCLLLSP